MKSQTDLIVLIVALVLTIFTALGMLLLRREPVSLQPPTAVNLQAPKFPAGDVTFSTSLPGGSSNSTGGGRGGFGGGMPGMPGGMPGMPGGMPGMPGGKKKNMMPQGMASG